MRHYIFEELTVECGNTAEMFANGLEKKEIAAAKFRAFGTISTQLQKVYEVLGVRNRSELTKLYCKKLIEKGLTALLMICLLFAPAYRITRRSRARRSDTIEVVYDTTEYAIA